MGIISFFLWIITFRSSLSPALLFFPSFLRFWVSDNLIFVGGFFVYFCFCWLFFGNSSWFLFAPWIPYIHLSVSFVLCFFRFQSAAKFRSRRACGHCQVELVPRLPCNATCYMFFPFVVERHVVKGWLTLNKTGGIYLLIIHLAVIWLCKCFLQTLTSGLMYYNSVLNGGAIWFHGSLLEKYTNRFLGFSNWPQRQLVDCELHYRVSETEKQSRLFRARKISTFSKGSRGDSEEEKCWLAVASASVPYW